MLLTSLLTFFLIPLIESLTYIASASALDVGTSPGQVVLSSWNSKVPDLGIARPDQPFWLEEIKHQGTAPLNSDASTYKVFRNIKDFGAKGDGKTDDTAAINAAISAGARCGQGCDSTTTSPAVVYIPSGTYLVSSSLIALYLTQIVGDARNPPTLLAGKNFTGLAVIDANPYIPNGWGAQYYVNQNNFFRSVRNIHIDLRSVPAKVEATGLHWQVSQATSLQNVVVDMSTEPGTQHRGMFMENGSGGFMGDLVFNGGNIGLHVGNQQFTVRNLTVSNANTAVKCIWNWGWTFQDVNINNCSIGFALTTGGTTADKQGVGAVAIIDARINNTPTFIENSNTSSSLAGSLVLTNIHLTNVPAAVSALTNSGGSPPEIVLLGTSSPSTPVVIDSWAQGNIYSGTSSTLRYVKDKIPGPGMNVSGRLLEQDGSGRVFGRGRPQYEGYEVGQFVSVKSEGAKGDGQSDDTKALQAVFDKYSGKKIIFLDAGVYYITDTLRIHAGTQLVGEGWSVIMGGGSAFAHVENPRVMVQCGERGSEGVLEITDVVFTTRGPAPGAIVVEWNVNSPIQGGAGMWDTHIRLAAGTNLQANTTDSNLLSNAAAYLALHITPQSNGYFEGTWIWLADHNLDAGHSEQISLYSGRGLLSESKGPVWLVGTASEHHVIYQYYLHGAEDHYMGLIQTESPYWQPNPPLPAPFTLSPAFSDPSTPGQKSSWGLIIRKSKRITVFGAGLYSFFDDYTQACIDSKSCQSQVLDVDGEGGGGGSGSGGGESGEGKSGSEEVRVYSLSTVGVSLQVGVNGKGAVPAVQNQNGFQVSVFCWKVWVGGVLMFWWCRILLRFGVRERDVEGASDDTLVSIVAWWEGRKGIRLCWNGWTSCKIVKLNPDMPFQM
ncbi:glycoside hydrolase family 55 protein [Irpex lacteus]|nr:glycoside hydrolase family 55 protein [Irpex lacteus]